jgi:hypothetical protein
MNKLKSIRQKAFFIGICVGAMLTELIMYLLIEYYIQT